MQAWCNALCATTIHCSNHLGLCSCVASRLNTHRRLGTLPMCTAIWVRAPRCCTWLNATRHGDTASPHRCKQKYNSDRRRLFGLFRSASQCLTRVSSLASAGHDRAKSGLWCHRLPGTKRRIPRSATSGWALPVSISSSPIAPATTRIIS